MTHLLLLFALGMPQVAVPPDRIPACAATGCVATGPDTIPDCAKGACVSVPQGAVLFTPSTPTRLTVGDRGTALLTCDQSGDWASDDLKLSSCVLTPGHSWEEVLTIVVRSQAKSSKQAWDEVEKTRQQWRESLEVIAKMLAPPSHAVATAKHCKTHSITHGVRSRTCKLRKEGKP